MKSPNGEGMSKHEVLTHSLASHSPSREARWTMRVSSASVASTPPPEAQQLGNCRAKHYNCLNYKKRKCTKICAVSLKKVHMCTLFVQFLQTHFKLNMINLESKTKKISPLTF